MFDKNSSERSLSLPIIHFIQNFFEYCARLVDFFTTKNFQDHGHPCVSGDAPSVSVMPEQFIEMLLFL